MKKMVMIFALIVSGAQYVAQADRHSTLFYGNAVKFNPAASGMINGDGRLFTSYRNQWSTVSDQPFSTINFSADAKTLQDKLDGDFVGVGINFFRDVAGEGKFIRSSFSLSGSYAVKVKKKLHLSFGASAGWGQYKINDNAFTWGNQWDGAAYDLSYFSNEPLYNDVNSVFDLAAGVHIYGYISDYIDLNGGIAVNHILGPQVSFVNMDDRLYRHISISLMPEIRLKDTRIGFVPAIYAFTQGPNQELTAGVSYKYFFKESSHFTGYYDEKSLNLGAYHRVGDALIFTAGMDLSGIGFGVGYDLNTSSLKKASNGVGAFEFFLRYRFGFSYTYNRRSSY